MTKRHVSTHTLLSSAIIMAALASGCSLKSADTRMIRIQLPQKTSSSARIRPATSTAAQYAVTPTALSDFQCYGINVIGPGIAPDPRLRCTNGETAGKFGGFVPVTDGAIEVAVPAGPGRQIQLFAVMSGVGCPSLDALFTAMDSGDKTAFNNIGDAYLVAAATTDIFEDTTITLTAFFDPNKKIFQNCSGTNEPIRMPPSAAYSGQMTVNPVPTPSPIAVPVVNNYAPGTGVGAPEISGTAAADLTLLNQNISEYDFVSAHFVHSISGTTYPNGSRAIVQLQWDVTDLDLTKTPYAGVEIQARGGAEGANCPITSNPASAYGIAGSVYYPAGGYWIPIGAAGYWDGIERWHWLYSQQLPQTLSQFAVTKTVAGLARKFILVNVESNHYNSSIDNCSSVVRISRAALALSDKPIQNYNSTIWPLYLTAFGGHANLPGTNYVVPTGGVLPFFGNGGVGPYTYSLSGASFSSIDPSTGHFVAGSSSETIGVVVTDSRGISTSQTVRVVTPTEPIFMQVYPSMPTVAAGQCTSLNVSLYSITGTSAMSASSFPINFNMTDYGQPSIPYIPTFYTDATCTTTTAPVFPGFASTTSFYVILPRASSSLEIFASASSPALSGNTWLNVTAAVAMIGISGPSTVMSGGCVAFNFYAADQFGSPVASNNTTITFTPTGSPGTFYSDNLCMIPVGTATIAPSTTSTTLYYSSATVGAPMLYANPFSPAGLTSGSWQITVQ